MHKIKVTFSDGSNTIFHEEQVFITVGFFTDQENPNRKLPSQSETFGLWNHIHDGLVPSFLELLANSNFFVDSEEPNTYYNSNAVVKIEIA